MKYNTAKRHTAVTWLTICAIMLSMITPIGKTISPTEAEAAETPSPVATASASPTTASGALVFEGFRLEHVSDDNSIRALVDVYLKDYDATGVAFTLEYDDTYLQPSYYEADTSASHTKNQILTTSTDAILSFSQNKAVFPKDDTATPPYDYLQSIGSSIDTANKKITLSIIPSADTDLTKTTYIGEVEFNGTTPITLKVIKAAGETTPLKLGTMCFRVNKPYQFANITNPTLLASVLKVANNGTNDQAQVMYVDSNEIRRFVGYLPITWKVDRQLSSVEPIDKTSTVSAYKLYDRCSGMAGKTAGTLDDLFAYLNQTMANVKKTYTDLTTEIEAITWDKTQATVTIKDTTTTVTGSDYDPRGGVTYVIEQDYGTTGFKTKVEVTITKSELTGFKYDRRVKTYSNMDRPLAWSDLLLPNPIIPIVTGVDDTFIPPEDKPDGGAADWDEVDDWSPNTITATDTLNTGTPPVSQTYMRTVPSSIFTAPWLTIPSGFSWNVDAIRNVVTGYSPPSPTDPGGNKTVTAEVDRETGSLKIKLTKDAFGVLAAGDGFTVYLPDGTALNSTDAFPLVKVDTTSSDVPADGAIVTVYMYDPTVTYDSTGAAGTTMTDAARANYQNIINLGNSDFKIAKIISSSPTMINSDQLGFEFDARKNYYLWEKEDASRKYDEVDYSEGNVGMFPVYVGQALSDISTYIIFPDGHKIPVAFNGQTGEQPVSYTYPGTTDTIKAEELGMAKVESWAIEGDPSATALPATQDTTLTLVGKLKSTSYMNFGEVTNGNTSIVRSPGDTENVYLKIKVTTMGTVSTASPSPSSSPSTSPGASSSPSPSATPTADPSASPGPSSSPTASATPVPGESVRIKTVTNGGTYVNGAVSGGPEVVLPNSSVFEYDTKTVGYTSYQNQIFKIENNGTDNLSALTLDLTDLKRFSVDDSTTPPTLVPVTPPLQSYRVGYNKIYDITSAGVITPNVTTLAAGDSLFFDIRNMLSLPVGVYTATVNIGSSHSSAVGTFDISFTVTEKDVYKVEVDNSAYPTIGIGYLMYDDSGVTRICSNTYAVGDTVHVHADMLDTGYEFAKWQVPSSSSTSVTFADDTKENTTFTMVAPVSPDTVVKVEPTFQETNDVWIRLTDLHDYNPDSTENALRNAAPPYSPRPTPAFSESTYAYRTIVDGEVEKNYVTFDVKDELLDPATTPAPMTVEVKLDGTALTTTQGASNSGTPVTVGVNTFTTTKFTTDTFNLKQGANVLTITTKYVSDTGHTYTKTYTLTIFRKKPVDVKLTPGNSPYGLIEGSFTTDAEKTAAKANFDINNCFKKADPANPGSYINDTTLTPSRAVNTYETHYYEGAWDKDNYDKSTSALFVYEGTTFIDPGFTDLKDSDGNAVTATTVKRKIKDVNVIDVTTNPITSIADLCDDTKMTKQNIPITNTGASVVINELSSKVIRPGVYFMEYSFTDSDGSDATFTRPIIVLAPKGNMNLGLGTWSVSPGDTNSNILYQRLSNGLYDDIITSETEWKRLYAYRIGDVTEDENVNSVDANAVLNSTSTTLGRNATVQYYEPLPSSLTDPWPTMDPASPPSPASDVPLPTTTPKPTLVLDYLGKGTSPNIKQTNPNILTSDVYTSTNNKFIWVGIGVTDIENLDYFLDGLYSMDFGIDYDPNIFEPCDMWGIAKGESGYDFDSTMSMVNTGFSTLADTKDVALWKNAGFYKDSYETALDFNPTPTPAPTLAPGAVATPTPSPTATPSAAATPTPVPLSAESYKTEFVTIKSTDGTNLRLNGITSTNINNEGLPVTTDRIYLLRVPFRLKAYPPSGYTGYAMKLHLTEQTFVMGATDNGVTNSASWEGDYSTSPMGKTTDVNNAKNHFDKVEIADLFGTSGLNYITGTLKGWNPAEPFVLTLYRRDGTVAGTFGTMNADSTCLDMMGIPASAVSSSVGSLDYEADADGTNKRFKYGWFTYTDKGEVTWDFRIPVPSNYDYRMEIRKMSHVRYPDLYFTQESPPPATTTAPDRTYYLSGDTFTVPDPIEMVVGDTDQDGYIKDPDRAGILRYYNQQKPWLIGGKEWHAADLNGDGMVDMYDMYLWDKNEHGGYKEGGGAG